MSDDGGGAGPSPASGTVLKESLLYRESTVVPGIVKKRYGVLFADRFVTRSRADDPAAGFGRVWPLSPSCTLSAVHRRKLSVLGTKQHHSLWALLSGSYEDRDLFRFTLTAGEHTAALAFDDAGDAAAWHAAFKKALEALGGGVDGGGGGGGSEGEPNGATPRPPPPASGARPATPGWRGAGGVRRAAASVAASAARRVGYVSGGGSAGGAGDGGDDLAGAAGGGGPAPLAERSASAAALERDLGRVLQACMTRGRAAAAAAAAVAETDAQPAAAASPRPPAPAPSQPPRPRPSGLAPVGLTPWYTEDGVTAYCGRDADGDDVLVESFVVRAPPRLCVATLLRGETEGGATAFGGPQADPPELLAVVDAHTQYLRLRWRPSGWLGAALVAPRELTLKRAWRRDDDGQYVVLYTSVEAAEAEAAAAAGAAGVPVTPPPTSTPTAPPPQPPLDGGWYGEWAPAAAGGGVRGRVLSSGYTFAPLLPEYDPARACGETLVTHVAKLDAGGVVGALRRSRAGWARALAAPAWSALLHPLAQRSVLLKHRAEAERFVARPFLAGARSGTAGVGHPALAVLGLGLGGGGDGAGAEPASPPVAPPPTPPEAARVAALATNRSIFRRGPSVAAAAEAAVAAAPPTPEQQQPPAPPPPTGTMPPTMWSCPGAAGFKVRGPHYLEDHRKVEAGATVLELASVDLVELDAPAFDVARFLPSIRESGSPFSFVVNLMIPGTRPYSVVIAWAADRGFAAPPPPGHGGGGLDRGGSGSVGATTLARFESVVATAATANPSAATNDDDGDAAASSPFDLALARFLAGGDSPQANARRDDTFKLIPRVAEGPWVVRQSVGSTPCLLGHKLRQRYSRGPNYMEVDIDVASSSVAATVVGLVMGATKAVVVDLAIVLQGNAADELPEALLGTVRLARVDMAAARYLDTRDGKLYEAGDRPADAK